MYPESDNIFGCNPLTWEDFPSYQEKSGNKKVNGYTHNLFVMVQRGKCGNVTKVRNIENFGASVALIADYVEENVVDVVMEDNDGSGFSLRIPGFLVEYQAAKKIMDTVDKHTEQVIL